MLAAIAGAKKLIHLEMYIFGRSGVGAQFVEALSGAARRGLIVDVIIDGLGSFADGRNVQKALLAAGCRARIHNPFRAAFLGRLSRNHRKLLLIDDELAFLGGINIGDAFLDWADLVLEIHGAACARLGRRLRGEHEIAEEGWVRIYLSSMGGGHRLRRRYLKAFASAKERLLVAHSYFFPDPALLRSLTAAARRGVEVSLLLPGRSDLPLVHLVATTLYQRLTQAGIKIFEWSTSVLHAKAAVVDGRRVLLGSFNLEPFSLIDLDALVQVDDPEVAMQCERWIGQHIAGALSIPATALPSRWPNRWLGAFLLWMARAIARLIWRISS